jgi:hypothetical protein
MSFKLWLKIPIDAVPVLCWTCASELPNINHGLAIRK